MKIKKTLCHPRFTLGAKELKNPLSCWIRVVACYVSVSGLGGLIMDRLLVASSGAYTQSSDHSLDLISLTSSVVKSPPWSTVKGI